RITTSRGDGNAAAAPGGRAARTENNDSIPEEFRPMLGSITREKTIPQIRKFVEAGGSVVTIGSGTNLGEFLGLPVRDH
ncbi:hypothetical protein NL529_33870, partial [Klebsiella pneumoniae]|nr:hypothetical protein [Klebsiella pneumoniae]